MDLKVFKQFFDCLTSINYLFMVKDDMAAAQWTKQNPQS